MFTFADAALMPGLQWNKQISSGGYVLRSSKFRQKKLYRY